MKYMGSKARISEQLIKVISQYRDDNSQYWVEPFVGGCNMIDKVSGNRIGADSNEYLIEAWKALQNGWIPSVYTKDDYQDIKANKDREKHVTGYVGICCSYSGKWFGGYAGKVQTRQGIRDYQKEALQKVMKQVPKIKSVEFIHSNYKDLQIPDNSIIYCDPPYEGTSGYKDVFNHKEFWEWCRTMSKKGHKMFVSEYNAPEDFECIWEKGLSSSLSANGKSGGNKKSVEKLFTISN